MSDDLYQNILRQYAMRLEKNYINSIKINLYREYEVEAVAAAIQETSYADTYKHPDCIMVADSYLTTHLGRSSTRLCSVEEQQWFLKVMQELVTEVRQGINLSFWPESRPYLIADMPDGSVTNLEMAFRTTDGMLSSGADAVKIEVSTPETLNIIEALSQRRIPVIAHIGYTPQAGISRAYGLNYSETMTIFATARAVRDHGAVALVIERVSEVINQSLCTHRKNALPVYSIFSGKSLYGGQSLNVWDAVFLPSFKAKLFPPTACFDSSAFPSIYTHEVIKKQFAKLLMETLVGNFPPTPSFKMDKECITAIQHIDPWCGGN
jgi:ketopantoate hydroxymethyltransferase